MKKLIILILVCVPAGIFAQESPDLYKVKNEKINDFNADFETTFLENNNVVFTSPKEELVYNRVENSSKTLLDSAMEEVTEDDWLIINESLFENTNLQKGMVSFTKDKKTVFFSVNKKMKYRERENEKEEKIKSSVNLHMFKASVNENGKWVNIKMLPFNNNRFSTGQPILNHDDTKLYFVSDGPESLGRTDIFVVDLHKDGTYGEPMNLGPKINSSEREIFPFVDKDNLLYYLSDVRNERGDLDVFGCKIFDNTMSSPVKLKGPVNIEKDDFAYDIDYTKNLGYKSFNRQVGKGVDDIYASIDSSPINIECQQKISGVVKNVDTQELLPNVQIMLFDTNDNKLLSFLSNEMDASFSFKQSCNTTYKLKGYLEGYLIGELDINTANELNGEPLAIVMNMSMEPSMESDLIADMPKVKDAEAKEVGISTVETVHDVQSNEDPILNSQYNFNSDNKVYTVQIGAFQGNVQTDKFIKLSGLFNHLYDDGFNRYYSGIFESYLEAKNYIKLLKENGYNDAFVVGLKGEKRF